MLMRLQMRMTHDSPGQQVMWKICGQGRAAHECPSRPMVTCVPAVGRESGGGAALTSS